MRPWRRLVRGQRGQVLYLTLVMMMVLVAFSLVLANVIYLAVMKVKAQNVADAMALSGATLQARLMNSITNLNGILFGGVSEGGVTSDYVYPTFFQYGVAIGASIGVAIALMDLLVEQDRNLGDKLRYIALANGIDEQKVKIKIHSVIPWQNLDYSQLRPCTCVAPPLPGMVLPEIAFLNLPWSVQSRVEWQTKDALIGGKYLGVTLPDIVARARAEIVDNPLGPATAWNHYWCVQLAQPDDRIDRQLRGSQTAITAPVFLPGQPAGIPQIAELPSSETQLTEIPPSWTGGTNATPNAPSTHTGRTGGNSGVVLPGGTGSGNQGRRHGR